MSRGEQAWEGTLGTLLSTLRTHATEGAERSPKWPRDEKGLADALQRETPVLTDVGVKVENLGKRCVGNGGRTVWRLTFTAAAGGDAEHADHVTTVPPECIPGDGRPPVLAEVTSEAPPAFEALAG